MDSLTALTIEKLYGSGDREPAVAPVRVDLNQAQVLALAAAAGQKPPADLRAETAMDFAVSVARGLSHAPRRLDCRFLYDARGSEIFERICEQPEYYLTRTEGAILAAAAGDIARRTGPVTLVELGSGSGIKTQIVLEAYSARHGPVRYTPVDISKSILELAEQEITAKMPHVKVEALHGTYEDAFPLLASYSPCLLLFLGSTVGNLDSSEADRFWEAIAAGLMPGDFCLLGVDINEDPDALHAAYNDGAGYSAAFTRNLFERMNRELGASLNTPSIEHVAAYNPEWRRVEIFARFTSTQSIDISQLGRSFRVGKGEQILTEVSRKFRLNHMVPYLATFGLAAQQIYSDEEKRFAVLLLRRV